jgi:glycosyltransferase involved in cell wall biosynthesis
MPTEFFTICASNYLAFARVLGRSLQEQHPDAGFTIWLIGGDPPPADLGPFRVRPIAEAFAEAELEELAAYYDILELATSVKPRCFKTLFAEGADGVIYLDPDIQLFRPLDAVFDLLAKGASGVVTPHVTEPLPADGETPDDLVLLGAGLYNLGFLALSASDAADEMLDWWASWVRTHCFSDRCTGSFTDQKWINDAPLFWPSIRVLRDPTYNVAYWNLSQRRLDSSAGEWTVDGRPLVFFHYSGFDPEQPHRLSKYQSRISPGQWPALAALLVAYVDLVREEGHAEYRQLPPPSYRFENGRPVDGVARAAFRRSLDKGHTFPRPLGSGEGSFHDWLSRIAWPDCDRDVGLPLSRYLMSLYRHAGPIAGAFADPLGRDRIPFLRWAIEEAPLFCGADSTLLGDQLPERFADHSIRSLGSPAGPVPAAGDRSATFRRTLIAWQLLLVQAAQAHPTGEPTVEIGAWDWESATLPESQEIAAADEIWVPSRFLAQQLDGARTAAEVVSPLVHAPRLQPDRLDFALPENEFVYLAFVDPLGDPRRANPHGAIQAFVGAFRPEEPVRLVLVSEGAAAPAGLWRELHSLSGVARVSLIDESLDHRAHYRLLASVDALVSLHRWVGFGERIAEAMSLGNPVIATGWGGCQEYMTPRNSISVDYRVVSVESPLPPFVSGARWAEPTIDDAVRALRALPDDRALVNSLGTQARRDMERYGAEAVAREVARRLQSLTG